MRGVEFRQIPGGWGAGERLRNLLQHKAGSGGVFTPGREAPRILQAQEWHGSIRERGRGDWLGNHFADDQDAGKGAIAVLRAHGGPSSGGNDLQDAIPDDLINVFGFINAAIAKASGLPTPTAYISQGCTALTAGCPEHPEIPRESSSVLQNG